MVGLVGKSGSGKSTLLNLLAMNDSPSKGTVAFLGKNIAKLTKEEKEDLRSFSIGFIYQNYNLLDNMTVLENVMMPLLLRGENKRTARLKAIALIKEFKLERLEKRIVKALSGGEKQRISILRALIGNPSVILADEPTGALDQENGEFVMECLKEASKTKLVILVTHNVGLANKYIDYRLRLEDGMIVESDLPKSETIARQTTPKRGKSKNWRRPILLRHLKENAKKNLLSVIAGAVGYLTIILSIGFFNGSNTLSKYETKRLLTRYVAGISKEETVQLDNSPLSLIRVTRPSENEIKEIVSENIVYKLDYSYFFPKINEAKVNNLETKQVSLVPQLLEKYDTYRTFLVNESAVHSEENWCLINCEFASQVGCSIGDIVSVNHEVTLLFESHKETVSIHYEFFVDGIVKEFPFLNEPRIYYDYERIYKYLSEYETEEGPSLIDLVERADPSDPMSSFQYRLFALNDEGCEEIEKLKNKEGWAVSCNAFNVQDSFDSLHQAITTSLTPFLVLEVVMIVFIVSSIAFSSFIDRKKEAAILNSIGARRKDIVSVYVSEGVVSSLAGMILAFLLSNTGQSILNGILMRRLALENLVRVPFGLLLVGGGILFASAIAYVGTKLPLRALYKYPLAEALREQ